MPTIPPTSSARQNVSGRARIKRTHNPTISSTTVAVVRDWSIGRSLERATPYAENVAAAAMIPAGIANLSTRSTNPGT
jgi:hypothetical protein